MKADYVSPAVWKTLYCKMGYENALALQLCLETGMRIGDAVALRPCDINGKTVTFCAQKTGKIAVSEISANLAKRLKTIAGKNWVFVGRDSRKHRTRQAVYKDLRAVAKQYGVLEHVSPHSARKTYAVSVYRSDGLKACKERLQHDNETTTLLYAIADKITAERLPVNALDSGGLVDKIAGKVLEGLKNFFSEHLESP